jgi:hypothetical protein
VSTLNGEDGRLESSEDNSEQSSIVLGCNVVECGAQELVGSLDRRLVQVVVVFVCYCYAMTMTITVARILSGR